MKTGQIGQSVLASVAEDIRSESSPVIRQIRTASDHQQSLKELAILSLVQETGDAGQHGRRVTGTTRSEEAESASGRMEFEAEIQQLQSVRPDPVSKRSTVTDGVRGRNGRATVKAVLTDLAFELALVKQKNATDRTEKSDPVTDQTRQCLQSPSPLQCRSTWSSELAFPVLFSELWLAPRSSSTT